MDDVLAEIHRSDIAEIDPRLEWGEFQTQRFDHNKIVNEVINTTSGKRHTVKTKELLTTAKKLYNLAKLGSGLI